MAHAWTKYKLTLTGMEVGQMGEARTKRVIEAWAEESGVMSVANHMICADYDAANDTLTYTAELNSMGWTGISP